LVDGDRVYIYGVEGTLQCLRAADGKPVWKVDTADRFGVVQNFFGVASSPVVYKDLLLVMVGGSPPESQQVAPGRLDQVRPSGSGIVAFDKHSGQVRYQLGDELASYSSLKILQHAGRDWCLAWMRDALLVFDPATGTMDFRYPWRADRLESVNAMTPVVHDGQLFISETYGPGSSLLALRPEGYQLLWRDSQRSRAKAMQAHWSTPVYHQGFLYGCSGRYSSTSDLRCIDWATGKVQWSERGLGLCSLLLVDDHLVCLSEDGALRLVRAQPQQFQLVGQLDPKDPETGRPLLQYPAWAAPILSHGLLYVRGGDRVVCLDLMGQPSAERP
jgi:outer membrane protein assembly factor BamB